MAGRDEMDISAVAQDDIIEDVSEGECDVPCSQAPPAESVSLISPGMAGRFESFLGARESEGDLQLDADTQAADPSEVAKALEPIDKEDLLRTEMNGGGNVDEEATLILQGNGDEVAGFPGPEADTLPEEDVHLNEDGTLTGGPAAACNDSEEEELEKNPLESNFLGHDNTVPRAQRSTRPAELSDGSSDGEEGVEEQALLDEDWKDLPPGQRELWERVRPRALRREAARVKALKLPAATMNRLTRLHPDMQTKTSDALETINCATVLLLQAVAQATIRGRKAGGRRVKLDDVKQVCLNNRELQFLLPLSATLDASTLSTDAMDGATSKAAAATRVAAGPGQSTLSSSTFARNNVPMDGDDVHADDLDVVRVQGNIDSTVKTPQEKKGSKRKLPPTAKKAGVKVARQTADTPEKATVASGMATLFKPSTTV